MTAPQRRVLDALTEATKEGWPATVREVQELAGYRGPARVFVVLHELRESGYAVQHPQGRGWLPYRPIRFAFDTEDAERPTPSPEFVRLPVVEEATT